jgi:uncharacterized protein involved in outer membrane biogenesis
MHMVRHPLFRVACVVALAGALAAWLVSASLAGTVRRLIIEEAYERYGADVQIGSVGVRLFPGRVTLRKVSLRQRDGGADERMLAAERISVAGSLFSLLGSGERRIRRLELSGVSLTVERTAESGTRIAALHRRPRPAAAATPTNSIPATAEATGGGNRPASSGSAGRAATYRIDRLNAGGTIRFVDTSLPQGVFAADLATVVKGEDLHWQRKNLADGGVLHLSGNVATNPALWAFGLAVNICPPEGGAVAFDATGNVTNARPAMVAPYLESAGVTCSNMDVAVALQCRGGAWNADRSRLKLAMREVRLTGKQARKTGMAGTLLDAVTLSIPVSGDISKPEFNLTYARVDAMAGQPEATDQLLKQASRAASSALSKWMESRHRKKAAATNDTSPAAGSAPEPSDPIGP